MEAAPLTLINGDTLIDLLIQHEIGVKKTLDYYEFDESAFQQEASDEIEEAERVGGDAASSQPEFVMMANHACPEHPTALDRATRRTKPTLKTRPRS